MNIEIIDVDQLVPYEHNPRNNDAAIDAVATSIQEFGWKVPIVCDEQMVIIAGHTRYKAALKLGLKKVPVHVAKDLSPEQVRAFRIADNKTGEIATWDMDILPIELSALQEAGFDMDILAFNDKEMAALLDTELQQGLTDPDAVPEPPDEAITQRGDIWILGDHRLMCGDSASPEDVDLLLDGATIQLCNTDPPYNVKVEPRSNNAIAAGLSSFTNTHHQNFDVQRHPKKADATHAKLRPKDRPLENDFVSDEEFDRLLDAWFGNITRVLEPGRALYCWGGYANLGNYPPMLKKHDLYFSQGIVWDKQHPVLTRKDFMGAFEICFYCWKLGAGHKFFGPNNARDLWAVKKINPQSMEHLTAKPAELAVRAIQYSSKPGENVLDLFGGSGSTLIGAEQTGRKSYLMEIDLLYCDVIADRFQRFSGTPAILERTGTSPLPMKPREKDMR